MHTWRRAKHPKESVAGIDVYYVSRPGQSEGGHEIAFPDGRVVRVLPDGHTSGQKRSRLISEALRDGHGLLSADYRPGDRDGLLAFVVGRLALGGLTWELIDERNVSPVDVIGRWVGDRYAAAVVESLEAAGWEIVRKGEA